MGKEPRITECEDCGCLKWIYHKGMDLCPECWDYRWMRADSLGYTRRESATTAGTYFIQGVNKNDEYFGLVKIGAASDPTERLANIQRGVRRRLEILGVEFGGRGREGELHKQFAQYRRHLEWFIPADEIMEYIFENTMEVETFNEVQKEWLRAQSINQRMYMPYPHPILHMHGAWLRHDDDPAYAPMLDIQYMTAIPIPYSMFNPSRDELREVQLPLFPSSTEEAV